MKVINLKSILFLSFLVSVAFITIRINPPKTTFLNEVKPYIENKTPIKIKITHNETNKTIMLTSEKEVNEFVNELYKYKLIKTSTDVHNQSNLMKTYFITIYYGNNFKLDFRVDSKGFLTLYAPNNLQNNSIYFKVLDKKIDYGNI